jgi:hypothetical protein
LCRKYLAQLRKDAETITENNVSIVAIVPTDAGQISEFLEVFGPYPFPLLGDADQTVYKALGHKHMPMLKLLFMGAMAMLTGKIKTPKDPREKRVIMKAMRTQDIYQQGGTWLFSEKGEVLWNHLDNTPLDHATIDEIIQQVSVKSRKTAK